LTTSLAIMGFIGLAAILYGSLAWEIIGQRFGIDSQPPVLWRTTQWLMTVVDDSHTVALLVRFGLSFRSQLKGSAMAL